MAERGGAPDFGDVTGEYLALHREAGVVTGWHELVWVRGPDTVRFLDGLISQAVEPMAPGEVRRSLLLAPQGKLRAPLAVLRGEREVGLLTDPGCGQRVVDDLTRFKVRVDVAIAADEAPVAGAWGPEAAALADKIVGAAPDPGAWLRHGDTVIAAVPFARVALPRIVVAGPGAAALVAEGPRAGRLAADAVRIEAGEPLMDVDVDERTIPAEAGMVEGAVAFDKGCYLGQELVARIDSRGHVNRHLRGLKIHHNTLPPPGADVLAEGRDGSAGTVTSVAESLDLRAPVALALVRREVEPGAEVTLSWPGGSVAAQVRELPLDDFT